MRKTVSQSEVAAYIKYAEKQVLTIVGALLSDKEQRRDAQDAIRYVFTETMRSYYGVDKAK